MMMSDLNSAEREAISPLGHDFDGRFSRKGVKAEEKVIPKHILQLIDSVLIGLFIFFLAATDFMLFANSGNIEIFKDSIFPESEISWVLLIIFILSALSVLVVHKFSFFKHILAGLFVLLVVYIIFKQFAQFYKDVSIGSNSVPLYTFIGVILAALTYIVFAQRKILYKSLLTLAAAILFLHIYVGYMQIPHDHDFIVSHNTQKATDGTTKRFLYLMFPNLISPTYLLTIDGEDAIQTREIMEAFFLKNNFQYYTKAYGTEEHYLKNMIRAFNPRSSTAITSHILNTRMLTEYWRFYNLRNDYIFLKNNELYDVFRKNGFQLSAYKTRDIDMCQKNHRFSVNRCVEKINHPISVFDVHLPTSSRVNVLVVEWLDSMRLFGDLSRMYNFFQKFFNLDDLPMLGISYNNLYVVNSIKTFDVILNDMKSDSGKQAYVAFIDLPSDMYVYDEYCQIKPRKEWLNMKNLPWVKSDYVLDKQQAYLQQTRCLFGKLEQFVDNLEAEKLWDDTVIIIQGMSGVNDFRNQPIDDAKDDFMGNRLVTMAIHDNKMEKGSVNSKLCSTSGILSEYLFKNNQCQEEKPIMHESIMSGLSKKLDHLSAGIRDNDEKAFDAWYKKWAEINGYSKFDEELVYQSGNDEEDVEDFDLDNVESLIDYNMGVFEQSSDDEDWE